LLLESTTHTEGVSHIVAELTSMGSDRAVAKLHISTATVVGTLLAGTVALQTYLRWRRLPRGVPQAWKLWPFGHLHIVVNALRGYRLHDTLVENFKALGDTILLDIPTQPPFIFTIDPKNVEHILKTNFENYPKGQFMHTRAADLLGDGIFNADGALWHSQRKTSSKMFTANKFKTHIWKVVHKNSDKVVSLLEATNPGEVVDIFDVLNRFTLDSIGEIGFGADIRSLEKADSPFLQSFDRAQQILVFRFFIPGWQLFRFFGLGTEWSTRRHIGLLRAYSSNIVNDLKGKLDGEVGDSFVGLFMKSGEATSNSLLEDLVLNFLIAGRDTTAQAMAWCLWNIMQKPEVEKKILDEGDRVCGEGQPLTYEKISSLEYLGAVISESLRLYPSVPIDVKTAAGDDTLPDGSFVPRGTTIAYSAFGMGRSTKIWGEDAEQFKPDRWLDMATPVDAYSYPVFHAGPRECLGKRLAQVEMKSLLLTILRHVKLELAVPVHHIRPDLQLTLGMSSGLPCTVRRR